MRPCVQTTLIITWLLVIILIWIFFSYEKRKYLIERDTDHNVTRDLRQTIRRAEKNVLKLAPKKCKRNSIALLGLIRQNMFSVRFESTDKPPLVIIIRSKAENLIHRSVVRETWLREAKLKFFVKFVIGLSKVPGIDRINRKEQSLFNDMIIFNDTLEVLSNELEFVRVLRFLGYARFEVSLRYILFTRDTTLLNIARLSEFLNRSNGQVKRLYMASNPISSEERVSDTVLMTSDLAPMLYLGYLRSLRWGGNRNTELLRNKQFISFDVDVSSDWPEIQWKTEVGCSKDICYNETIAIDGFQSAHEMLKVWKSQN